MLEGYDFSALLKEMKHTPVPDDVVYVPSVEELEALDVAKALQNKGFGGIPIEIGYCNGHNKKLNAVEYHRSSEINVAVTDLVLLIGSQQDITDDLHMILLRSKHSWYLQEQVLKYMQLHFIMRHAMYRMAVSSV